MPPQHLLVLQWEVACASGRAPLRPTGPTPIGARYHRALSCTRGPCKLGQATKIHEIKLQDPACVYTKVRAPRTRATTSRALGCARGPFLTNHGNHLPVQDTPIVDQSGNWLVVRRPAAASHKKEIRRRGKRNAAGRPPARRPAAGRPAGLRASKSAEFHQSHWKTLPNAWFGHRGRRCFDGKPM